jgi:hypothetical protein
MKKASRRFLKQWLIKIFVILVIIAMILTGFTVLLYQ